MILYRILCEKWDVMSADDVVFVGVYTQKTFGSGRQTRDTLTSGLLSHKRHATRGLATYHTHGVSIGQVR